MIPAQEVLFLQFLRIVSCPFTMDSSGMLNTRIAKVKVSHFFFISMDNWVQKLKDTHFYANSRQRRYFLADQTLGV